MGQNNPANQAGYWVGVIFGGLVVGMLCGALPLWLGRKRQRMGLGWLGFGLCAVSGIALGLIGAVPMAGLTSLMIVVVGPPATKLNAPGDAASRP